MLTWITPSHCELTIYNLRFLLDYRRQTRRRQTHDNYDLRLWIYD